jgi:hypothetical protein
MGIYKNRPNWFFLNVPGGGVFEREFTALHEKFEEKIELTEKCMIKWSFINEN